jgi:hypothetical protein
MQRKHRSKEEKGCQLTQFGTGKPNRLCSARTA